MLQHLLVATSCRIVYSWLSKLEMNNYSTLEKSKPVDWLLNETITSLFVYNVLIQSPIIMGFSGYLMEAGVLFVDEHKLRV